MTIKLINNQNNIKLLKNKNTLILLIFNNLKLITIFFNKDTELFFDLSTNTLTYKQKIVNFFIKPITLEINRLVFSLNYYWNMKIKFKGKGLKIRKFKKKSIKFFFYRSHLNLIIFKKTRVKKKRKTKILIFKKNKKKLFFLKKLILSIRSINKYTLRGLRTSRQLVKKRSGKKSTYM